MNWRLIYLSIDWNVLRSCLVSAGDMLRLGFLHLLSLAGKKKTDNADGECGKRPFVRCPWRILQ